MTIDVLASGSTGNAYTVDNGETKLLLDCGLYYNKLKRLSGYTMGSVEGCLITHEHGDHASGVYSLMKNGIDLYMSCGTATALGIEENYRCHIVDPQATFAIGTWQIMPLPVEHDAVEPFAYLLGDTVSGEKLIYATDTPYMPYRIPGITHMMVEVNYAPDLMSLDDVPLNKRVMRSHMSIDALIEWIMTGASRESVREVWLLHLSDARSDADAFKKRVQAATGAEVRVA